MHFAHCDAEEDPHLTDVDAEAEAARKKLQTRAELALLGTCAIWGISFVLVKEAMDDASAMVFCAIRFSVASVPLVVVYFKRFKRDKVPQGALVGFLVFLGFALQTMSMLYVSPAKSAFLTGVAIPLVPILSAIAFRLRPAFWELVGVLATTVGTFMLTSDGDEGSNGFSVGDLLGLGCALFFAIHMICLSRVSSPEAFPTLAICQSVVPAVLAAVTMFLVETPFLKPTARLSWAVLLVGLLATALGMSALAWAMQHTTATRGAVICSAEPVFAAISAYLIEGDVLSTVATCGGGFILAGILLSEVKPSAEVPGWAPQWVRAMSSKAAGPGGGGRPTTAAGCFGVLLEMGRGDGADGGGKGHYDALWNDAEDSDHEDLALEGVGVGRAGAEVLVRT